MSKVTKKDLQQEIHILKSKNTTNRNLIFRTMRALASIDIDIMDDKFDATDEPKLKVLDQSVFDGLHERWVAASVEENGTVRLYLSDENNPYDCEYHLAGTKYDTTDWQNSLIEREELTGSDLCRAMLERGDKYVLCFVSDFSDDRAASQGDMINLMTHIKGDYFYAKSARWGFAVPINQQTGEPLTAADVGL